MGYGNFYRGIYRDYYGDPVLHSLLSTREFRGYPESPIPLN